MKKISYMQYPWTLQHRITAWNLLNTAAQIFEDKYKSDAIASGANPNNLAPQFTLSPIVSTAFEYLGHFWESNPPPKILEEDITQCLFRMCAVSFWATCKVEKIPRYWHKTFDLDLILYLFLKAVSKLRPQDVVYRIFDPELTPGKVSRLLDSFEEKKRNMLASKFISFLLSAEIVFYAHSKVMKFHSYPFAFFNKWAFHLRSFFNGEHPIGDLGEFRVARQTIVRLICSSLVSTDHSFSSSIYSSGSYVSDNNHFPCHIVLCAAAFREGFSRHPGCNLQNWEELLEIQFDENQNQQIEQIRAQFNFYEESAQSLVITQN